MEEDSLYKVENYNDNSYVVKNSRLHSVFLILFIIIFFSFFGFLLFYAQYSLLKSPDINYNTPGMRIFPFVNVAFIVILIFALFHYIPEFSKILIGIYPSYLQYYKHKIPWKEINRIIVYGNKQILIFHNNKKLLNINRIIYITSMIILVLLIISMCKGVNAHLSDFNISNLFVYLKHIIVGFINSIREILRGQVTSNELDVIYYGGMIVFTVLFGFITAPKHFKEFYIFIESYDVNKIKTLLTYYANRYNFSIEYKEENKDKKTMLDL